MSKTGRKVRIFSALEVANICGVVNQTAINWIKNGYLKAFTTPGGQYRIYAKDLAAFLDKRGMAESGEALNVLLERADWNIILIASDDRTLRNQLKEEINSRFPDFEVLEAIDCFEIGRFVSEEKPGFIILDDVLPGVDCYRLIRIIKNDPVFGNPFIFVMSQSVSKHTTDNADGVFPRPPDSNNLVETIGNLEKLVEAAVTA